MKAKHYRKNIIKGLISKYVPYNETRGNSRISYLSGIKRLEISLDYIALFYNIMLYYRGVIFLIFTEN